MRYCCIPFAETVPLTRKDVSGTVPIGFLIVLQYNRGTAYNCHYTEYP